MIKVCRHTWGFIQDDKGVYMGFIQDDKGVSSYMGYLYKMIKVCHTYHTWSYMGMYTR